jgi:hypothetical protein
MPRKGSYVGMKKLRDALGNARIAVSKLEQAREAVHRNPGEAEHDAWIAEGDLLDAIDCIHAFRKMRRRKIQAP